MGRHLFLGDPLTLLVGIHFCAVYGHLKDSRADRPLPSVGRRPSLGVLSSTQPGSFWRGSVVTLGARETKPLPRLALDVFLIN